MRNLNTPNVFSSISTVIPSGEKNVNSSVSFPVKFNFLSPSYPTPTFFIHIHIIMCIHTHNIHRRAIYVDGSFLTDFKMLWLLNLKVPFRRLYTPPGRKTNATHLSEIRAQEPH